VFPATRSARRFTPRSMSFDMMKSAGMITSHALTVSHQGLEAARHRKIRRERPSDSSGTTWKTQLQSTAAVPLRLQWQVRRGMQNEKLRPFELLDNEPAVGFW
jgi:hypothetical protein